MFPHISFIDRKFCYRLGAAPSVPLYAGARSAGFHHVARGWTQPSKTADYLEFFWCESGSIHFPLVSENRSVLLTSGSGMFLFPGDLHCQQVRSCEARYYWLTIDGHPEDLRRDYQLTREPFFAGQPPEALFQRLFNELGHISDAMQYQASSTALEIIHYALSKKDTAPATKPTVEFCRIVEFQFSNTAFNVEEIARQMGISRVTLYRLVRNAFGCTPKEYLERCRLREAIKLLTGTRLPVQEIASRCGYAYPNYFSRIFREKMDTTPEKFRKTSVVHISPNG